MVSNQTDKIKEAKMNIIEAESTAIKIQEQLYKNTETLGRSIENVFFYINAFFIFIILDQKH